MLFKCKNKAEDSFGIRKFELSRSLNQAVFKVDERADQCNHKNILTIENEMADIQNLLNGDSLKVACHTQNM